MNWRNYGKYWEVDHIQECVRFDLTDLKQCQTCFGLNNLRPLDLKHNRGRYHAGRRRTRPTRLTGLNLYQPKNNKKKKRFS
jgi:hypothetical protein